MSKILRNTTLSPITIADTGITIPASSSYTIPAQDYLLWANSSNVVSPVGSGALVVNDGSVDLSVSLGMDLIKGLFPKRIIIAGGNSPFYDTDVILGSDSRRRICVDATLNTEQQAQYLNKKYRVVWNNVEATIPLSTSYTSIFSEMGSGFFYGAHIATDKEKTEFKFVVDGEVIVTDASLKFIKDLGFILGGAPTALLQARELWNSTGADLDFSPPLPVKYDISFELLMRNPAENWKRQRFMYQYSKF